MAGELELEVGAGPQRGTYQVRVVRAPAGGEPTAVLHLDVDELLGRRPELERTLLASSVPARRVVPVPEQSVLEVGRRLFEALFTGPVDGAYRASLGVAQERHQRLRLVLWLTAPELAALPWEMLFDPETNAYLCRQEPLVRHVSAPFTPDPLQVRAPLRILGLIASPRGLPGLDSPAEREHLQEALAEPIAGGQVHLEWVEQASWHGVHARLLAGEWHVLHFIGHGDYDTTTQEGVLAFVGSDGRADLVEASRLADLLSEADPSPRLVVLNSCSSGQSGAGGLFSGTAAALVRSGISAVAAMQFTISDTAAISFARGFYPALATGRTIDEAVRSGRISILGTRGTLKWLTPVLYVRGDTTRLFTLTTQAVPPSPGNGETPTSDPARRRAELRALYVEASAEVRLQKYDSAVGLLEDLLTLDPHYPGAAELRATARRQHHLADTYQQATTAENTGDWSTALALYTQILDIDPAYQDAEARNEACQRRQQVANLHDELRLHAAAERWQAVLAVNQELIRLDPGAADPDGLASHARHILDEQQQRAAELEHSYAQARAAEDAGNWAAAVQALEHIVAVQPDHPDAVDRLKQARAAQHRADLQADLRRLHAAGQWAAVVALGDQLAALDPNLADPDGLVTAAKAELAEAALAARYTDALRHLDRGDHAAARAILTAIHKERPDYRDATTLLARTQEPQPSSPANPPPQKDPAPAAPAPRPTLATPMTPHMVTLGGLASTG